MARKKGKVGVLVVDMQYHWFYGLEGRGSFHKGVESFLLRAQRVSNCLYVDYEGFESVREMFPVLEIPLGDVYKKNDTNAFSNWNLKERIVELGISTLAITGVCATQCVLGSIYGARFNGFNVITSPDLVMKTSRRGNCDYLEKYIDAGVEILDSCDDVLKYIVSRNR